MTSLICLCRTSAFSKIKLAFKQFENKIFHIFKSKLTLNYVIRLSCQFAICKTGIDTFIDFYNFDYKKENNILNLNIMRLILYDIKMLEYSKSMFILCFHQNAL